MAWPPSGRVSPIVDSSYMRQSLPGGYLARQSMDNVPVHRSFTGVLTASAAEVTRPGQPEAQAGIGLLMQQDLPQDGDPDSVDSRVFIKSVVAGGPADRDGGIKPGDRVVSVNGESCQGQTVAAIREKILGPTGSQLSIILESAANGELYQRVLTRGAVQQEAQTMNYASSVGAPSLTQLPSTVGTLTRSLGNVSVVPLAGSNDSEIARLKRRIAELEAHVGMADSENQRLRAMLDQERRNGSEIVRDVDSIHRSKQQQLDDLTHKLNKSEQARREMELVISSAKAREEEFQLAFNRAREQTEAREAFFADLKIQFEEAREIFERDTTLASASKEEALIAKKVAEEEAAKYKNELHRMKHKELERREKELTIREMLNNSESSLVDLRQLEERVRHESQAMHLLFAQWHKDYFLSKTAEEQELEAYFLG